MREAEERLSTEEKDHLERSVRNLKSSTGEISNGQTFKDMLVGKDLNSSNFLQTPQFEAGEGMALEEGSGVDNESMPSIFLSQEERRRIREPWKQAIIVKVFGKSVGYKFLLERVTAMWKVKGDLQCIDLGKDFFIFKFSLAEDLHHVIFDGPWFVSNHYLTMRMWEPNFKPHLAVVSTTAVWVRLPGLPIELYDIMVLRRIGNQLGTLLRIDSHTANSVRGRFARLCIQVDLDKALIPKIRVGEHIQPILYEGVSALCYSCGCLGHRQNDCPNKKKIEKVVEAALVVDGMRLSPGAENANLQPIDEEDSPFGKWMVVERKKPNYKRGELVAKAGESTRAPRLGPNLVNQFKKVALVGPKATTSDGVINTFGGGASTLLGQGEKVNGNQKIIKTNVQVGFVEAVKQSGLGKWEGPPTVSQLVDTRTSDKEMRNLNKGFSTKLGPDTFVPSTSGKLESDAAIILEEVLVDGDANGVCTKGRTLLSGQINEEIATSGTQELIASTSGSGKKQKSKNKLQPNKHLRVNATNNLKPFQKKEDPFGVVSDVAAIMAEVFNHKTTGQQPWPKPRSDSKI